MDRRKLVIAFDLYGTLLSTDSIADDLKGYFGPDLAPVLAKNWRRYQLEYTWRLNSMNQYQPFSMVTRSALLHAISELDRSITTKEIDDLMAAYNTLSIYPDVRPAIDLLTTSPDIIPVIFSNGTDRMISESIAQSPDLSPHASLFQKLVTVEPIERFKPDPKVYKHLAHCVGMGTEWEQMEGIWLVTANPFDVIGARAMGMNAVWVKRQGVKWSDELIKGEFGEPTFTVEGVQDAVRGILRATGKLRTEPVDKELGTDSAGSPR